MASGTYEKNSLDWQLYLWQQQLNEWLEHLFNQNRDNLPSFDWQLPDPLQKALFWMMVVGAFTWIGWQLYKLLRPYWISWQRKRSLQPLFSVATPTSPLSLADWLHRSRTAQQQGNYREACRALYMAALQQLNDLHLIQQDPSRTDGEYLNLMQTLVASQPYQILVQTHERLCFSNTPISNETFDQCWQAYQQIEAMARE